MSKVYITFNSPSSENKLNDETTRRSWHDLTKNERELAKDAFSDCTQGKEKGHYEIIWIQDDEYYTSGMGEPEGYKLQIEFELEDFENNPNYVDINILSVNYLN